MKQVMSEKDFRRFETMVKMTQSGLKRVMMQWLQQKYDTVVETNDYIYAIGNIPIALAAHLDTVFPKPVMDLYYDTKKNIMFSPDGLGADDRAGVFAIAEIVRSGRRPHIILSTDEERGCIGASRLAALACPFPDLRYVIQLDRRGENDCVFYDCDNRDFVNYVEKFGFEEAYGSFTDITEYCPAWEIAGVNLSVGYRNEHSASEILNVTHLFNTIEKVKKMLDEKEIPSFKYIPYAYGFYGGYGVGGTNPLYHIGKCGKCNQSEFEEDMYPVVQGDGSTRLYCPDCLSDRTIHWCSMCQMPFDSTQTKFQYICPVCATKEDKKNGN